MNCYLCAAEEKVVPAIAACPHCGAGLCMAHFDHPQLGHAGMQYGCNHVDEATRLKTALHPRPASQHDHRGIHGMFGHASKG